MGTRRLRIAAAAVGLGFVLALVLGAAGIGRDTKAFGAGTVLTVLSGEVSVRHGSADFAPATDGEVLNEGDTIRTGPDGRAVLTYFEGSNVTIEPDTVLGIDAATTLADGGTVVVMTQSVGRTWHVVTKLIAGSSKYEVRTPASTASVRGTEFEVDASDDETTVTTTEGTVIAQVADPVTPSRTVEVPVTSGTTQTQPRNAPPAQPRRAPEPERKVTVTVAASNTLVVDPLGRSNGVTKDGKTVAQTPGAQVRRDGDKVVVTLPNIPDGTLATQIDKKDARDSNDVEVKAKVEDKGHGAAEIKTKATAAGRDARKKSAGIELKRAGDGTTEARGLKDDEKKTLPSGRPAVETPSLTRDPNRTPVGSPTRRATSEPTPTPRATLSASATPRVTPEPTLRETPEPTATRRPTAQPTKSAEPSRSPRAEQLPLPRVPSNVIEATKPPPR